MRRRQLNFEEDINKKDQYYYLTKNQKIKVKKHNYYKSSFCKP